MPSEDLYAVGWEDTTFIYPDKSFAEVEVGDRKQSDFYPQVKIKRWMNECNFSARLKTEHNNPEVVEEDGKIKWKDGDVEAHFYELEADGEQLEEGGLEFEIVYHKKPKSNVVEFTVQTKGLDFFYQPYEEEGVTIPENVKGSYAVYHKTQMHNKYKTGKAFHIYRPHVVDADGNETWADLHIDVDSGTLEITVPQNFLNHAVYPVLVDPTLGYTSIGATAVTFNTAGDERRSFAGAFTMPSSPATAEADIQSISVYGSAIAEFSYVSVWSDSGQQQERSASFVATQSAWNTRTDLQLGGTPNYNETYLIGASQNVSQNSAYQADLTGGTGYLDDTQQMPPTSFDKDVSNTHKMSAYFTYYTIYNETPSDGLDFGDTAAKIASTYRPTATDGVKFGEPDGPRIRTQHYKLTHLSAGTANQFFDLDYTVDPDHAFVITHVTGKDNSTVNTNSSEWGIRARITDDGTQIHLVRSQRNSDTVVSCQVIECFSNEFTVQRNSSQFIFEDLNASETETISSVDTSKSMILVSCGARFNPESRADLAFVTAEFNSSTEIQFERGRTTNNGEDVALYWQVVEFNHPDITVQTGEVDCSGDISAGITEAISSVDTSRAWAYTQYRTISTSGNESGYSVRTRLTSSTQLTIDRYTTLDKESYLRYWVVEWPSEVTVHHYASSTSGINDTSPTVATYIEGEVLFDVNASSEDSTRVGVATVAMWDIDDLTDSTTIQMRRYITIDVTDTEYALQMIDFTGWIWHGPAVTVLEISAATDGIDFGDTPIAAGVTNPSATEGIDFGDTSVVLATIEGTPTDGVDFSDTATIVATINAVPADGINFGDTPVAIHGFLENISDGVVFSELVYSFFGTMDYLTDGIELSDTPVPANVIDRGLTEGIDFSDTPTIESIVNALLTDGLILSDIPTIIGNIVTSPSDGIDFSDTPAGAFDILRSTSDGMILSDTTDPEALIEGVITDGLVFSDSISHDIDFNVDVSDGMTFGEQLDVVLTAITNASDGVDFGDEALPYRVFAGEVTDGVILADVTETATNFVTSLTEGLVFSEVLLGDFGGRLIIIEAREIEYLFYAEDIGYRQQANPVPYTFIARVPPTTLGEP